MEKRESTALRMKFGLDDGVPRTNQEIGLKLGVASQSVGHIIRRAMYQFKSINRSKLSGYFENS